jgi:ubiquinone/menaquinone biosynthesis C-methylase UbiE
VHSDARPFIPAAGRDWLLPLYDPFNRLLGTERFRRRLLEAAALAPGARVLDLGTGTGELALLVKRLLPAAAVVGVDPDAKALARARAKAARAGLAIDFEQGYADALPFADGRFDAVVSSLVLHHLTHAAKGAALREVARVLAPGGSLHVLDFGPSSGAFGHALSHLVHRGAELADHLAGELPSLMREAGLAEARERERMRSLVGSLSLYEARRSGAAAPSAGSGAPV